MPAKVCCWKRILIVARGRLYNVGGALAGIATNVLSPVEGIMVPR
jgi:hypothetical protein